MSSAVEQTLKTLVEFEAALDKAKDEASDSKKKLVKDAAGWGESAKAAAISKAQELASARMDRARKEAEKDAESIRKSGEASLKTFESTISRRKQKAADHVVARLLGVSG